MKAAPTAWPAARSSAGAQTTATRASAQMVVLRSGDGSAGQWVSERVDLRRDALRLFGQGAEPVQLAVTADTDNTGGSARSGFADFHFAAAHQPCEAP